MKILGIGHTLPEPRRVADVQHPNGQQLEAIISAGYDKFYVSRDSCRVMGARAVRSALEEAGYNPGHLGFIVAAHTTVGDYIGIDFACQIGAELGDLELRTLNLVEGCGNASAWFSAHALAAALEPGQVGAIVFAQRVSEAHFDRLGLMTAALSDGAVAAIVGRLDGPSTACGFVYRGCKDISRTHYVDMMRIERGGGLNPVLLPDHDPRLDALGRERVMELYDFSGDHLAKFLSLRADYTLRVINSSLRAAAWPKDDKLCLIHTLEGRQTIESLAYTLELAVENTNADLVGELGHVGCVDQLLSVDLMRKQGRLPPGSRVAMSSIATGMKWGCCLLEREDHGTPETEAVR